MSKQIQRDLFLFWIFPFFLAFGFYQHSLNGLLPYCDRAFFEGLPLYYWSPEHCENFGDYLSLKIVEKITDGHVIVFKNLPNEFHFDCRKSKLLAVGSIIHFASDPDVIWGSGINGKHLHKKDYLFKNLDVRAVRGPLTRQFLMEHFSIECPEIYGDPALLAPYFFPEFKRKKRPSLEYVIIPHISEESLFPKSDNVIYPSEPWDEVIKKILDSKFVISSSLHGIVIAEAWGIPARLLRVTENEPLFKYEDYYLGTGRPNFQFATSVEEALKMGGEPPFECDLEKLYEAFPFECWGPYSFKKPNFSRPFHH